MACFSWILAIISIFAGAESFAPILWAKIPGKRLALMPNSFAGHHMRSYALPQKLTIGETSGTMVPYFTAQPDNTISVLGWCIEAAGRKCGDAVLVNNCDGGPAQQWNLIPDAHGRSMIQLKDSNLCFDVIMRNDKGSLNGALVKLQHCENKASEAWLYEAPLSVPGEGALSTVMFALMALAGVGALSLRALFFGRSQACVVAGSVPFGQDLESGVSMMNPLAFHEGTPARSPCTRRGVIRMRMPDEKHWWEKHIEWRAALETTTWATLECDPDEQRVLERVLALETTTCPDETWILECDALKYKVCSYDRPDSWYSRDGAPYQGDFGKRIDEILSTGQVEATILHVSNRHWPRFHTGDDYSRDPTGRKVFDYFKDKILGREFIMKIDCKDVSTFKRMLTSVLKDYRIPSSFKRHHEPIITRDIKEYVMDRSISLQLKGFGRLKFKLFGMIDSLIDPDIAIQILDICCGNEILKTKEDLSDDYDRRLTKSHVDSAVKEVRART